MKNRTSTKVDTVRKAIQLVFDKRGKIKSGEMTPFYDSLEILNSLEDALYEILDQVRDHTGPMPMMVRAIAEQALGEKDDG